MTRLHTEEFDVLLRDALRWLVEKKKKEQNLQLNELKNVGQNILLQSRLAISASNVPSQ